VVAISFASFLGGRIGIVCIIFADNESQYNHYVIISMNSPGMIQVTSLKIVDAVLMLILMMRQRVCRLPVLLKGRPMIYLWQYGTMQQIEL
jgi:hypothetical protein